MERKHKNHVPITDDMYTQLVAEKKRTGIGSVRIYRYMHRSNLLRDTQDLNCGRIDSWFSRRVRSAALGDFQAVLAAYKSIPTDVRAMKSVNAVRDLRLPVDQAFLKALHDFFKPRPNFNRDRFLQRENAPERLTSQVLSRILSGNVKSIEVAHREFLERIMTE